MARSMARRRRWRGRAAAGRELGVAAEVEGERDSHQHVDGEESVDGEGAHPAVDVGAGGAAGGEGGGGERTARPVARTAR